MKAWKTVTSAMEPMWQENWFFEWEPEAESVPLD